MNVLMISGDPNLLKNGSEARERNVLQASVVEKLDTFVWPHSHSIRDIRRAALAGRYDVITAQDPFWRGLLAWWLARRTGARLNLQIHADFAGQPRYKRLVARFTLPHASSVRAVSERVAAEARVFAPQVRITVLPVYVNLDTFRRIERVPHKGKAILWVGRFESEKNPAGAIEALKTVRESGLDAKLIMLGDGSDGAELRIFARGLPVEFPGWQRPESFLARADVVLSTSPHESFGASIVEALAAGVPVVSLDVGVAREAGAIVVPPGDLASAVARVLREGAHGLLKLDLSDAQDWAMRWRESLI